MAKSRQKIGFSFQASVGLLVTFGLSQVSQRQKLRGEICVWQHKHGHHFPCSGNTDPSESYRLQSPSWQASKQVKKKFHLAREQLNTPLVTSAETPCKDFAVSVALTLIVSLCLIWEDKKHKRRTTHELFVVGFLMLPRTLTPGLQHFINLLQEQRKEY